VALPWPPYLIVDCKNVTKDENCTHYGYFYDLMNIIAKRFNFTFMSLLDTDWGVHPVNGTSFDWNGQFLGAKGKVS